MAELQIRELLKLLAAPNTTDLDQILQLFPWYTTNYPKSNLDPTPLLKNNLSIDWNLVVVKLLPAVCFLIKKKC